MMQAVYSKTNHVYNKSIQSLCIYQCVKEDEKLMMAMSLTYSLLNPKEVREVKEVLRKQHELAEIKNDLEMEDEVAEHCQHSQLKLIKKL